MKKISKAKNSFVAHAIVVAVSLFLVAFSFSAPGVAFAEDIKAQSSEPTQTLIDQPAVVAEATPAVEAASVPSDSAQVSGVEAVPGNSSTQKSEGASSALDNDKNTNVENSASDPAASSDSNATEFSTTQVEEKATIKPAADSPHRVNLTFKILYQGSDFPDGYEVGHSDSVSFVCSMGDSHASTAASHMISMGDVLIERDALAKFLREGYEIRGWTKSLLAGAEVYGFDRDGIECMDGETIYIVATYGPAANQFTVNFDAMGGSNAPESLTEVSTENEYTFTISDAVPTREGYNFVGWSTNSSLLPPYLKAGDTVTVSEDDSYSITLYAVWEIAEKATLTYMIESGMQYNDAEVYAKNSGVTVKGCDFVREGYKFIGWSRYPMDDIASYKEGDSIIMDSDTWLYAVWVRTYTVTYTDGQDGTVFENQVISGVESGTSTPTFPVSRPSSIVIDGNTYVFSGWDNNAEVVLGDMIINAIWKLDSNGNGVADEDEAKFSVTYTDGVGGTAFGDYVISNLLVNTATPLYRAPERAGYIFQGWSPTVADIITGNAIYTAIWAEDKNNNNIPDSEEETYTIIFINDVTGATLQTTPGVLGGLDTPQFAGPAPTMTGYVFVGWSPALAQTVDPAAADEFGNIYYIARWEVDANNNGIADVDEARYSVIYSDGANGSVFADQITTGLLSGLATPQFTGETPVRSGYIFAGWSSSPAGTVDPTAADSLGRIIYTALWAADVNGNGVADSEEPTYTITYTDGANGAAFADQVTSGLLGGVATPQFSGTPTRTGYKFVGWSTEPASTVSGDVVYTALWEAVEPDPTPGTDDPTPTPGPDDPAPTPGDDDDNTGGNGSATTPGTNESGNVAPNPGPANGTTTPGETTIADDETPLAGGAGETEDDPAEGDVADDAAVADEAAGAIDEAAGTEILDDENPLAAADHSSSWLSWLLTVGLLLVVCFGIFFLIRRRKNTREQNQ